MNKDKHHLLLRLPEDLHTSLSKIKDLTSQPITSQLIEGAGLKVMEFEKRLVSQRQANERVMNATIR